MTAQEHDFPFHHGDVALSLAGSVRDRGSEPFDRVRDRTALAAWLRLAHLTAHEPAIDVPTFRTAIELREAIYRTSAAFIDGRRPDPSDVATINVVAERWNVPLALDPASLALASPEGDPAKAALSRVARSAVELFADPERRARLRRCELASCGVPGARSSRRRRSTRASSRSRRSARASALPTC